MTADLPGRKKERRSAEERELLVEKHASRPSRERAVQCVQNTLAKIIYFNQCKIKSFYKLTVNVMQLRWLKILGPDPVGQEQGGHVDIMYFSRNILTYTIIIFHIVIFVHCCASLCVCVCVCVCV